jgi:type I restriction-modification system DNA methylase subunit
MPSYTCVKCAHVFTLKREFNTHTKQATCVSTTDETTGTTTSSIPIDGELTKESLPAFYECLHNLLWNQAGLNPEKAVDHMMFFFAYRLIEPQTVVIKLPEVCQWTYIASLTNENDLFEAIKEGTKSFRGRVRTKDFFKPLEIKKSTVIFDIVRLINRIPLATLQDTDVFGDIFEYMLGRGMSTMSDEGQYFTNRTICKLAFKLAYVIKQTLRRPDGSLCTFADWFCGTGGFPAAYVKGVQENLLDVNWKIDSESIYGMDMNTSSVTTTLLNMLISTGIPFNNTQIRSANSFSDSIVTGNNAMFPGLSVDYCFMNPPYGGDKTKGKDYRFCYSKKIKGDNGSSHKSYFVNQDIQSIGIEDDDKVSAGVQLAMATLSANGGVCSIVLPQGFFFGATAKCVELRKKIAEEYNIRYVVDIASGAFANTGTKTSMMVFQKGVGPTDKVLFIGMDEQLLAEATLEDLRTKKYSLNYKQYVPQEVVEIEGFDMVKLGDIIEIQYGTRITQTKDAGTLYPAYGGGGLMTYKTDTYNRDGTTYKISRDGMSEHNCVLKIMGKYFCNDTALTVHTKNPNQALEGYIGEWLLMQNKVIYNTCSHGTAQLHIDLDMLRSLQIPLPSIKRQQKIVEEIDANMQMANHEEVGIKLLEKAIMLRVEDMGAGQPRVKLGDVCEINFGKRITKKDDNGTIYPVYGGGNDTFRTDTQNRSGFTCKISRFGISEHNCVQTIYGDYWLMDSGFTVSSISDKTCDSYIYYWLVQHKSHIYQWCGRATAQMNMDMDLFRELEIPLPPLSDQQLLQPDFDEVRHKHAKIARYKAKAQEAIQRSIPGCAPSIK